MWGSRRGAAATDVLELLTGIGRLLQQMDGRLERIVELLEDEEDEPEDRS